MYNHQSEVFSKDEVLDCFDNLIAVAKENGIGHPLDAYEMATKKVQNNVPFGY